MSDQPTIPPTRVCLLLVGLVALFVSASVTAFAMRLRAQDAEVQLRDCRR